MTRPTFRARALGAASLVAAGALLAACADDPDIVRPPELAGGSSALMRRYVALGNSITAGFQSDGINDSTQQRAYPRLIALAAGTRYAYPALAMPGCRPPILNLLENTRVGGGSTTTCALRTQASASAILNNVAVPGANSFDPTGLAGGGYSALTTFFLGGKTQVERAIDADPTFATVWIGNNDVLSFALSGTTTGITPVTTFTQNYAAMINRLRAGSPSLQGGVLIGVVDVTNAPLLIPVAAVVANTQLRTTIETQFFGGRRIAFGASCSATTPALFPFPLLITLRQQAVSLPANATIPFSCSLAEAPPGLGQVIASAFLDPTERASVVSTVTAYNAYIRAKADSIGFAYYDPNVRLVALRGTGDIPVFPALQNPTQPFGRYISNDGVHPGTAAHVLLAQDIIAAINQKYGVQIPAPPTIQ